MGVQLVSPLHVGAEYPSAQQMLLSLSFFFLFCFVSTFFFLLAVPEFELRALSC
jgi:hypothetical protein